MKEDLGYSPDQVKQMVGQVMSGESLAREESQNYKSVFRAYECWKPYIKLLEDSLQRSNNDDLENEFVDLIYAFFRFYYDFNAAVKYSKDYLSKLKPEFETFRVRLLDQLDLADIEKTEYLKTLAGFFARQEQVKCLEYISTIFEKKLHDEKQLSGTYKKILSLEPKNLRSLRFFKTVYMQNEEWDQVADVLLKIIAASPHASEKYRVAHELSGVYLYQLDQPKKAIETLEMYCQNSPLDKSSLLYEAYAKGEQWDKCIDVLEKLLISLNDEQKKPFIFYRLGLLVARTGNLDKAREYLQKANEMAPQLWEPMEELIHVAILQKNWSELLVLLSELIDKVKNAGQKKLLEGLYEQLQDGIENATKITAEENGVISNHLRN